MSNPSHEVGAVAVADEDRLLALAATGAGLVDADRMAAAQAECRAEPGRCLIDVLEARGGVGAADLLRLRGLAEALSAPVPTGRIRFYPLRRLGSGELGEVWMAFDIDLDRFVAIKMLRWDATDTAESRARLRREALVVAQISHAGIVPIYATMRDAQGRPSHAMRLVSGESLQSEILRLQGEPDARPDAGHRLALLESVIQACAALASAHERGVVHRDLRPSNILREPDGTTFVIGWERARTSDGPDPEAGHALGVLGFAAPELTRGGEVDARADVYSLGAILFALWTGHVPDDSGSIGKREGRALPQGLAAICGKALAHDPGGRYAHAGELAEDLRAWREDRPLPNASEPRLARLSRALRRNPMAACFGTFCLMLLLVAGFAVRDASRSARLARLEAESQRAAGREATRKVIEAAQRATNRLEALAGGEAVRSDPRLAPFRRGSPEVWRTLFESLEGALSPWLSASQRRSLGSAILQVAIQSNYVGAYEQGVRAATSAEAIFRTIAADVEEGRRARLGQAGALRVCAYSLWALRRFEESLDHLDRALAVLGVLRDESPSDARSLSEAAEVLVQRALLEWDRGISGNIRSAFDEAIALATRAARLEPENPLYRGRVATYRMRLGDLAVQAGRSAEARRLFEQSLDDREALQKAQPGDPQLRLDLAASLSRLAHLDHQDGHDDRAVAMLDRALGLLDEAMAAEPDRIAHPYQRVLILIERARIADDARQRDAARGWLDQAMRALSPLLSRVPLHPDLLLASAQILQARGRAAVGAGDLNDAITQHQLAVNDLRNLLKLSPSESDTRRQLAGNLGRLAAVELRRNRAKQNDLGNAYQHALEAIQINESLLDAQPFHAGVQYALIQGLLTLAETQMSGAVRAEAYPTLLRCDAVLWTEAPGLSAMDRAQLHARLGSKLGQVSVVLTEASRTREADLAVSRALDNLDAAAARGWLTAAWLRRNHRLGPLRQHPRFQNLLFDLGMPRDPFQKTKPKP